MVSLIPSPKETRPLKYWKRALHAANASTRGRAHSHYCHEPMLRVIFWYCHASNDVSMLILDNFDSPLGMLIKLSAASSLLFSKARTKVALCR